MTKSVMIPGGHGQVGREVTRKAQDAGLLPIALSSTELNICDQNDVADTFSRVQPSCVINCAAYTAVDAAEKEPERARLINATGAANLARACADHKIPLLHISTDYVFDGQAQTPYRETDTVAPLGVYGATKLAGEQHIQDTLEEHIILRTSWVYAEHGSNFVRTMINLAKQEKPVKVVNDQFGSPTHAADIAMALLTIANQLLDGVTHYGTYHYTGAGVTTWHGMAEEIFRILSQERGIEVDFTAVATSQFPTLARRPAYSVLDCTKIKNSFGITPVDWQIRVDNTVKNLLQKSDAAG